MVAAASGEATGVAPGAGAADVPGAVVAALPLAGGAGVSAAAPDIRPTSSACAGAKRPPWREAYHAMPKLIEKNTMASHLVDLERKFAEPEAPKTVADAPAPKPLPAWAPAPRCMRISAIIAMAMRT